MALKTKNGMTDPSQFLFGIDVSNHNGKLDWSSIASEGFVHASAKVSEGSTYQDPSWDHNHAGMAAHMKVYWGYHYVWPNDPAGQARNARNVIGNTDVPIMMDTENMKSYITIGQLRDVITAFRDEGFRVPLDYLPYWYWSGHMGSPNLKGTPPQVASAYHHNVADTAWNLAKHVKDGDFFSIGGVECVIVQPASTAIVAGHHNTDFDVYPGTVAQLNELVNGHAPATQTKKGNTMTPDEVVHQNLVELYKKSPDAYYMLCADVVKTPWENKENPTYYVVNALTNMWKYLQEIDQKIDKL
jgi:hypothetical protein